MEALEVKLFERAKALIADDDFDEIEAERLYNSCTSGEQAAALAERITEHLHERRKRR